MESGGIISVYFYGWELSNISGGDTQKLKDTSNCISMVHSNAYYNGSDNQEN